MRICKLFFDFEKEEKWLNEKAEMGWELCGKSFNYYFRKTVPGNTIIKIDYRNFKNNCDYRDYLTLFKDSEWEHIVGGRYSGAQYFKRMAENSDTEIFSDTSSKASRYKRYSNMWLSLAITYIPILIALIMTKAVDITAFLNPKLLYYTPALWERTGADFWNAFWFETPFALMRGFFWLFFIAMILLYIVFAIKSKNQYRRMNASS